MTRVLSLAGAAVFLAMALVGCRGPGAKTAEQAPVQPIYFMHTVHAGQNKIPCMYCHYTADRSVDAGIPSVRVCVGCHVPGSAITPPAQATLAFPGKNRPEQGDTLYNTEAKKLLSYWQRQEPIPWVRIHKLPEHVKFPHMMHVNAGLKCQTCHGPVQDMKRVYQFASLQMGWCVDCHRGKTELSPEEEAAVQKRSSFIRQITELRAAGSDLGGFEGAYPKQRASTDCVACHY
ncbi:MAG TPA: cytochrome c3 family protein [Longimicrobiaceae bacterium]|nr:cytochrome c3 family protein [Longimicrobiaceae bacterium]